MIGCARALRHCTLLLLAWQCDAMAGAMLLGTSVHLDAGKSIPAYFAEQSRVLGTNTFRTDILWGDIERTKGELAFPVSLAGLERAIADAAGAGSAPLLILDYGNPFYDKGSFPLSDEAQAAFVRYVEFVATRFKGKVRHYEVWNEWNIGLATGHKVPYSYPSSGRDYARLLKKVYQAVKRIDPQALVIAGAVANRDIAWIDEMVASADGQYDGLSVHPYNWARDGAGRTPEEAVQWLAMLSARLARRSRAVPLYVTEMGWPSHSGPHGLDPFSAADYLARFCVLAREQPSIKGVWWYDFQDDGDNAGEPEHNFGLVTRRGVAKPAFAALRDVAARITQAHSGEKLDLGEGVRGVRLNGPGGKASIVVWSVQPGQRQELEIAAGAGRASVLLLQAGSDLPGQTIVLDINGDSHSLPLLGRPWIISGELGGVTLRRPKGVLATLKQWLRRLALE